MREYNEERKEFFELISTYREYFDGEKLKLVNFPIPAIADSEKISFWTLEKANKVLNSNLLSLDMDFSTISKDMSTYLALSDNMILREKYATMCKPGKFLAKICKNGTSPQVFAKFTSEYLYKFGKDRHTLNFEEWTEVSRAYNTNEVGCRITSCMTDALSNLKMYDENENVSILVLLNADGKLQGRALIWKNVKIYNDKENNLYTLMDRIYYHNENHLEFFKNYAIERNWLYKRYQSYDEKDDIMVDGGCKELILTVNLNKTEFDYYPYLDTFSYSDDRGNFYNSSSGIIPYLPYSYMRTDGIRCGDPRNSVCAECGEYIDTTNGETVYENRDGDVFCESCFEELYSYCEICEEYHPSEEIQYSDSLGIQYCDNCLARGEIVECDDCGDIHWKEDVYTTYDDKLVCYRCIEENYERCEYCSEYHINGNLTLTKHNNMLCNDCLEDNYIWCDECNEYVHKDEMHSDKICKECYNYNNPTIVHTTTIRNQIRTRLKRIGILPTASKINSEYNKMIRSRKS